MTILILTFALIGLFLFILFTVITSIDAIYNAIKTDVTYFNVVPIIVTGTIDIILWIVFYLMQ